jgi:hypothetical protein
MRIQRTVNRKEKKKERGKERKRDRERERSHHLQSRPITGAAFSSLGLNL